MSGITAAACCCNGGGGQPADCCEFWNNCASFTPTSVRLSVSFTRYRVYSNGQTLPIETSTYTVQSVGGFTPFGTNCILPCDFGLQCSQASVSFDHKVFSYTANVFSDSTTDGTHGSIPPPANACSGCGFVNGTPVCATNILYCLSFTDHEYGTGTLSDAAGVFKYLCGRGSDSCSPQGSGVGPRIDFKWPSDEFCGLVPLPNSWYTRTIGCCNGNSPIGPDPINYYGTDFALIGAAGCPDQNTWAAPIIDCPRCFGGCPNNACDTGCVVFACACIPACTEAPSNNSTTSSGQDVFSWQCISYYPDPANPTVVDCNATITYTEHCTSTVSVRVT